MGSLGSLGGQVNTLLSGIGLPGGLSGLEKALTGLTNSLLPGLFGSGTAAGISGVLSRIGQAGGSLITSLQLAVNDLGLSLQTALNASVGIGVTAAVCVRGKAWICKLLHNHAKSTKWPT